MMLYTLLSDGVDYDELEKMTKRNPTFLCGLSD
jgi:hypothetical protein